jgi:hypothetical protein
MKSKGRIESVELETQVHHLQLLGNSIGVEVLSKPTLCARLENAMYALLLHMVITCLRTHSAQLMYDSN